MKIPKVLNKSILVKKPIKKDNIKNGLYIPESSQPTQRECIVEGVGPNVEGVCVGDLVVLGGYGGTEVTVGDMTYLVMDITNVIAVLPKE